MKRLTVGLLFLGLASLPAPAHAAESAALSVTTAALPNPIMGKAIAGEAVWSLSATAGTAPYTWAMASGSLPAGLSLTSSGNVIGTPSAAGPQTFTIQVTDAASGTVAQQYTITAQYAIGQGCTTATVIDKDCDYYGVGSAVGPDADDNDQAVQTAAQGIAKYGSFTAFLNHLGYNPSRSFYISPTGNDSTAAVSDPTRPYRNYGAANNIVTRDGLGGAIIFMGGTYTFSQGSLALGTCAGNFTCAAPSASSPSSPLVIMAYPGQSAQLIGAGGYPYEAVSAFSNVVIDGLTFRNPNYPGEGYGISTVNGSNFTVRNVDIAGFDDGVEMGNHTRNFLLENSILHDNQFHGFYLSTYGLNLANQPGGDFNFVLDDQQYAAGTSVGASRDVTVRNNLFFNNGSGGYEPVHINTYANNVTIAGNIVHDNGGTGMQFQTGLYNSVMANNLIYNNSACGITFSVYGDDTIAATDRYDTVENNTIWTGLFTDTISGYAGSQNGGPGCGMVFSDNTDTPNGTHYIKNITIKNNIIATDNWSPTDGNRPFEFWTDSFPDTDIIQNNLLYNNNPPGASPADPVMNILSDTYPDGQDTGTYTFAQFQAYSPNFTNNLVADASFKDVSLNYISNPGNYDFDLLSSSPAVSAGLAGMPNIDLRNSARNSQPDVGAYQYGANFSPSVLPTIYSFSANPLSITQGSSTILSWSVSGATSVSIDNRIGSQTDLPAGSITVTPSATTVYTLTANNSNGNTIATAVVTVTRRNRR